MDELTNKIAIVTGGARDIGRQVSIKLAAEGAAVAVNYFDNGADAEDTVNTITSSGGIAVAIQGGHDEVCRCTAPGRGDPKNIREKN